MQQEYLSGPHAIVASCHSQKQKQLLPWDMLNKIMLVVGGFFVLFLAKPFLCEIIDLG